MDFVNINQLKENLWALWNTIFRKSEEDGAPDIGREKIVVFVVAFILALCLWLMVNLSRDYNLNVNLPIAIGNIPPDQALAEKLPGFATVSVSGEGWKLINIYNNPPKIYVDVNESEINLYDQVRQQMNAIPDISVQKVQPFFLTLELEHKVSKTIPLVQDVDVQFDDQFGFVGAPNLVPDSVTITGAASLLDSITLWKTDSVAISSARNDLSIPVTLRQLNPLIQLSRNSVIFKAKVAQYTEGEAKVFIRTREIPGGRSVSFSPSSIRVRYNVPINEYTEVKDIPNLFDAYVNYNELGQDSTGFITPHIEQSAKNYHLKIRSFQPRKIAYFTIIGS